MVAAVGAINSFTRGVDPEYLRIVSELRRLGISPSGNKVVDKQHLEQAKLELIDKIKVKEQDRIEVTPVAPVEEFDDSKRVEMENSRLGAMQIAELNKLYFKL